MHGVGFDGGFHPSGAQKALFLSVGTRPFALLQIELAQLGDVLQINVHAPAAFFDALGAGLPRYIAEAQRLEQARAQIGRKTQPCFALDDGGKHVAVHAVVIECGAGLEQNICVQKAFDPVAFQNRAGLLESDAACHGDEVPHCDGAHAAAGEQAALFRKDLAYMLVQ